MDLSALKGMANSGGGNNKANARTAKVDKRWLAKAVQQQATVPTATAATTSCRRVVLNGPGGLSIASSPTLAGGNNGAPHSATSVASKKTTFSVRLQSEDNDSNGKVMGMSKAAGNTRVLIAASDVDSNNYSVGAGSNSKRARVSFSSVVPAKVAADVPAIYHQAGSVSGGSRGRGHKGRAFAAGRGGRGGKGTKGGAGWGVGSQGGGDERSLEELISGGLAASRP